MSYQSLYRRYRPGRFDQIVGQRHIVAALQNAVVNDRVGHAYLFSGPRGTGKTSTARIIAKVLNCENVSAEGEPCDECESCLAFNSGTSYDLHELDAASNNGVEAIRDLIAKVALGSPGRTKVYVLDEVHMLTSGAENALLKTLEEPPEHVKFVLATTEPHKVVPTIRSRTQHLEFELVGADDLAAHVRFVIDDAGLEVGEADAVVDHVLRVGGGSVRDTLSALDQVVAAGGVHRGDDVIVAVVDALAAGDAGRGVVAVQEAMRAGRDPRVIGEGALERLRDAFLAAMGVPLGHLSTTARADAERWAEELGPAGITRALELIGGALVDMRQAPDPRVDLEVALIRLSRPEVDTDIGAIVQRLERLERGQGSAPQPAVGPTAAEPRAAPAAEPPRAAPAAEPPRAAPAAEPPRAALAAPSGAEAARRRLAESTPGADTTAPSDVPKGDRPTLGARRRRSNSAGEPEPGEAKRDEAEPLPVAAEPEPDEAEPLPVAAEPEPDEAEPLPVAAEPEPDEAEPLPVAAEAEPLPAAPEPAPGAAVDLPALGELTTAWNESILGALPNRVRARFAGGRFVSVDDGAASFGLPNDVHRDRCREVAADVSAALEAHFGRAVPLRLVVEGDDAPGGAVEADARVDDADDEIIDLEATTPATHATGIEAVTEVFPGAELVEPESD